jgi:dCTP deaminase
LVLSDSDIEREIELGNIKVDPPVNPTDISPSSLDVHLGNQISKVKEIHPAIDRVIDLSHSQITTIFDDLYETLDIPSGGYDLQPKEFILSNIQEKITLSSKISARIEGTSTLARFGLTVHSTAPTVHATYSGYLKLELCNHGELFIKLKANMRIAQLIFEYLKTPSKGVLQSFWQGK